MSENFEPGGFRKLALHSMHDINIEIREKAYVCIHHLGISTYIKVEMETIGSHFIEDI